MASELGGSDARRAKFAADTEPLNLSLPSKDDHGGRGQVKEANVKKTLNSLIRARLVAEGRGDVQVDFQPVKRECQLTPEELSRQKDRKEQNRKAAMRCREKQKKMRMSMQKEMDVLRRKNKELKNQYERLRAERKVLVSTLRLQDSHFQLEHGDQAVPVSPVGKRSQTSVPCINESESNDSFHNSNTMSDQDSDSDDDICLVIVSSSDEDSEDEENMVLDLRVHRKGQNLPSTLSGVDSDCEEQPSSSQDSINTQYDSGYPSSSFESDVHMSSQEG